MAVQPQKVTIPIVHTVFSYDDLVALTGTLYGEIRGGDLEARQNVAQVIMNRFNKKWAPTLRGVCYQPWQFSCWNVNDPNRSKILTAATKDRAVWNSLLPIAQAALLGNNPDRVNGADSYFARSMTKKPYWAKAPAHETFSDAWHEFWIARP